MTAPPRNGTASAGHTERADLRRRSAGLAALARCELVECLDGPARGQRRLEIDTPSGLAATLVVDRALDVLSLRYRGENLGWRSAARARHPVHPLEDEHGLGLMRSFDGLLVTCGLEHAGLPVERDATALRYPPRARTVHPLHGRLPGAGVALTSHGIDWDAGCVRVTGEVYQGGVFTECLVLRRRVEIMLDEPRVVIVDEVENEGFEPASHALLYHVNVGHPLLGEDARLIGDGWALRDRLDGGDGVAAGASPSDDHVEVVDVEATPEDRIGIENTASGLFLEIATDARALPVTALWRAFRSGVFALGIEPQTAPAEDDGAFGAGPVSLAPGERRAYRLELLAGRRGEGSADSSDRTGQLRSTSS